MRKQYKHALFLLPILFLSLIGNVDAVNCDPKERFWGMTERIDDGLLKNTSLWRQYGITPPNLQQNSLNYSGLIYDISSVEVGADNTLRITGWAFNISGSSVSSDVKFTLKSSSGEKIDSDPGWGGAGVNLKNWMCKRSAYGSPLLKMKADGSYEKVESAGECLSSEVQNLNSKYSSSGFVAVFNLNNLKKEGTYELHIHAGRIDEVVTVANTSMQSVQGKQIELGGGEYTANVQGGTDIFTMTSDVRPVGKNGLICGSWDGALTDAQAATKKFSKSTKYKTSGSPVKDQLNTDGGGINLYPTKVDNTAKKEGNYTVYAPSIWTKFDSSGSIKVVIKKKTSTENKEDNKVPSQNVIFTSDKEAPKVQSPEGCEGEVYNFFYFFLAGIEKSRIGEYDENHPMTNSADGGLFGDTDIIKNTVGVTSNSQLKLKDSIVKIDTEAKMNWFYSTYLSVQNATDKHVVEGNNHFFSYKQWCTVDSKTGTVIQCSDKGQDNKFDPTDYKKASIFLPARTDGDNILMQRQTAPSGLGFQIGIQRYINKSDKYLADSSQPAIPVAYKADGPNEKGQYPEKYLHPAVYAISLCKSDAPVCDDDKNSAVCAPNEEAIFKESDDLKACTLKKNNESGFTIIDEEETTGGRGNSYCNVACKDDIKIKLPGPKETAAGQYFPLTDYIPKIDANRTCVTSEVNYNQFDSDLSSYEPTLVTQYNIYQNNLALYKHLKNDQDNRIYEIEYNSEMKSCTYKEETTCGEDDTPDSEGKCYESKEDHYLVEKYKINGSSYEYKEGSSNCEIEEDGTKFSDNTTIKNLPLNGSSERTIDSILPPSNWESGGNIGYYFHGKKYTGDATDGYSQYDFERWGIYGKNAPNNDVEPKKISAKNATYNSKDNITNPEYFWPYLNEKLRAYQDGAETAKLLYETALNGYSETVKAYNACFSWVDSVQNVEVNRSGSYFTEINSIRLTSTSEKNTYTFSFKPTVSFDYNKNLFQNDPSGYKYVYGKDVCVGNGDLPVEECEKEFDPDSIAKYTYWPSSATYVDASYKEGGSSTRETDYRSIIDCKGERCTTASVQSVPFMRNRYVRRDENIIYTYHLPRIYTSVPSGAFSTSPNKYITSLILDPESVPIDINESAGINNYRITVKDVTDELRKRYNIKRKETNSYTLDQKFNGESDGITTLIEANDYICTYDIKNDIYIPSDDGNGKLNFFYRIVDTYDINPLNRTLGYNWADDNPSAVEAKNRMREDAMDYETLTSRAKFVFKLTPTTMQAVRNYNRTRETTNGGTRANAYADWDLHCDDYDRGGYHCYSNFLTCLASSGGTNEQGFDSCSKLFPNDVYAKNTGYDYGDLIRNRQDLIRDQNSLDILDGKG